MVLSQTTTDVAIVGGGVIGLSIAYWLALRGRSVVVLERQRCGQEASWAGAGIIPPGQTDSAATPIDWFRCRSTELFPALSRELHERTGIDNEFHICGGVEHLTFKEADLVVPRWRRQGIEVEIASESHLKGITTPYEHASYWLPGYAQVRNPRHLKALQAACSQLGVDLKEQVEVVEVEASTSGRVNCLRTKSGEKLAPGWTILATGAWTPNVLKSCDVAIAIQPVLGQMLQYQATRDGMRPIQLWGKRYLVFRQDGTTLVGSTEEVCKLDEKRTTPCGIKALRDFANELMPEFRGLTPTRAWAGLRPGSCDGLPYLGIVPGYKNLIVAAGHFRAGLQLSPGTAEYISSIIHDEDPFDLNFRKFFAVDRIPNVGYEPTFRS